MGLIASTPEPTPEVNHWSLLLVNDVRRVIREQLDEVSQYMLSHSCREEYLRYKYTRAGRKVYLKLMVLMAIANNWTTVLKELIDHHLRITHTKINESGETMLVIDRQSTADEISNAMGVSGNLKWLTEYRDRWFCLGPCKNIIGIPIMWWFPSYMTGVCQGHHFDLFTHFMLASRLPNGLHLFGGISSQGSGIDDDVPSPIYAINCFRYAVRYDAPTFWLEWGYQQSFLDDKVSNLVDILHECHHKQRFDVFIWILRVLASKTETAGANSREYMQFTDNQLESLLNTLLRVSIYHFDAHVDPEDTMFLDYLVTHSNLKGYLARIGIDWPLVRALLLNCTLRLLKWLMNHGVLVNGVPIADMLSDESTTYMESVLYNVRDNSAGRLKVFQFLFDTTPLTKRRSSSLHTAISIAVKVEAIDVLEWLIETHPECCQPNMLRTLIEQHNSSSMLKWFYLHKVSKE